MGLADLLYVAGEYGTSEKDVYGQFDRATKQDSGERNVEEVNHEGLLQGGPHDAVLGGVEEVDQDARLEDHDARREDHEARREDRHEARREDHETRREDHAERGEDCEAWREDHEARREDHEARRENALEEDEVVEELARITVPEESLEEDELKITSR